MKLFEKDELKLLWPFYLTNIIQYSFAIVPLIFFIYFQYKGFDLAFASFVFAVGSIGGLIFEVPTGVFADLYGRKKSVLVYYFSAALIFTLIPFSNKLMIILFFLLLGISNTFVSGAKEALVVDMLKQNKKENLIQKYFTKTQSILAFTGIFSGILLSSILFLFNAQKEFIFLGIKFIGADLIWIVQGAGLLVAGLILFIFTKENFVMNKMNIKEDIRNSLKFTKEGFIYSLKHPVIFALIISACLGTIYVNAWFISSQPFLIGNGIDIKNIGFLESIIAIVAIFLPLLAEIFIKKIKKNFYLAIVSSFRFLLGITILFVAGPIFSFVYFLIHRSLYYFEAPVESIYMHEHTPSKQRATVGSVLSLAYSISGLIASGIGALVLNQISPSLFIFLSSLLLIPVIIIYLRINKKMQ